MKEIISYASMQSNNELIKLDGNENYIPTDGDVILELHAAIQGIDFHRYPDTEGTEVVKLYGQYSGVDKDNIILGNGSDEMLRLVISSTISKGKKMLILAPDFEMYDFYCSQNEGETVKYKSSPDGKVNVENFIKLGLEENIDLVIISNPNNPTGHIFEEKEIVRILEAFSNKTVIIDEAYYEFWGKSVIDKIDEYENLIVTRTLSKAWGLAALRIGFLIANKQLVTSLKKYKTPYTVSGLSQAIACKMLERPERVLKNIEGIKKERENFFNALKAIQRESSLDIEFYPSQGNYIFGRSKYKNALIKALNNKKIIIRSFEDDSFRITVGSNLENERVIKVIRSAFIYEGELKYGEETGC